MDIHPCVLGVVADETETKNGNILVSIKALTE
jgi:hypothetical protein